MNQELIYSPAGLAETFNLTTPDPFKGSDVARILNTKFGELRESSEDYQVTFAIRDEAGSIARSSWWRLLFDVAGTVVAAIEDDPNGWIVDIDAAPEDVRAIVRPTFGRASYYRDLARLQSLRDSASYSDRHRLRMSDPTYVSWYQFQAETAYVEIGRGYTTHWWSDFPVKKSDLRHALDRLIPRQNWRLLTGAQL